MLIDFEYKNNKLILSNIDKNGNIKLKLYDWNHPTKFITCSDTDPEKNEKYTTWDGKNVKEIYSKYPNSYSVYEHIDSLRQMIPLMRNHSLISRPLRSSAQRRGIDFLSPENG